MSVIIPINKQVIFKNTINTIMKKVILGAFMLLAVAGTTMAQTAKKDAGSAKTHKMHHGKKHHKSTAAKTDASGTSSSNQK